MIGAPPWDAVSLLLARAAVTLLTVALMLGVHVAPAFGAEPSPVLIDPLDPRAEGEGPGLVGAPLLAAVVVLAIALVAAAATALYVRMTRR